MRVEELVKVLEKEYPDRASMLQGKSQEEIAIYLSQLEMIAYIKTIGER